MKLYLLIRRQDGTAYNTSLTLDANGCTVGRKDAHLNLVDDFCSRTHALIYVGGDGNVRIRDLGSRNGIYFAKKKVTDQIIDGLDAIRIGRTILFVLRIDRPPTTASFIGRIPEELIIRAEYDKEAIGQLR